MVTLMPARVPRVAGPRPAFIAKYRGALTWTIAALGACLIVAFKCTACADWIASDTPTINPAMIVNRITLVPYQARKFWKLACLCTVRVQRRGGRPGADNRNTQAP